MATPKFCCAESQRRVLSRLVQPSILTDTASTPGSPLLTFRDPETHKMANKLKGYVHFLRKKDPQFA